MTRTSAPPEFLVHRAGDVVGVATRDLEPGTAHGGYLHSADPLSIELVDPVPLGHKLAIAAVDAGADVVEYGVRTAIATQAITVGQHVHIHNVRSARWQHSRA